MTITKLRLEGLTDNSRIQDVREALEVLEPIWRIDVSLDPPFVEVDHSPQISVSSLQLVLREEGFEAFPIDSE